MKTKSPPTSLAELRDRFNAGEQFKFLHFWGHHPPHDGSISPSCFSQWYESPFKVDELSYQTAEHFMMASKARLFNDAETLNQILKSSNPGTAKALGRQVKKFDEALWLEHRFQIVCQANLAKFSQNPVLHEYLLHTGEKVLVEASPSDRIWGIGLAATDLNANNPNHWNGLNLLGFALMVTRHELRNIV